MKFRTTALPRSKHRRKPGASHSTLNCPSRSCGADLFQHHYRLEVIPSLSKSSSRLGALEPASAITTVVLPAALIYNFVESSLLLKPIIHAINARARKQKRVCATNAISSLATELKLFFQTSSQHYGSHLPTTRRGVPADTNLDPRFTGEPGADGVDAVGGGSPQRVTPSVAIAKPTFKINKLNHSTSLTRTAAPSEMSRTARPSSSFLGHALRSVDPLAGVPVTRGASPAALKTPPAAARGVLRLPAESYSAGGHPGRGSPSASVSAPQGRSGRALKARPSWSQYLSLMVLGPMTPERCLNLSPGGL